jgi:hypothetical protein
MWKGKAAILNENPIRNKRIPASNKRLECSSGNFDAIISIEVE